MTTLLEDFEKEFAQALTIGEDTTFSVMGTVISFPAYMKREDFDRMKAEVRAAINRAEFRGEQKAMAFLTGEGSGEPVGIVGQPEALTEKLTETGDGSFIEFIQEFAKALEFMNTMLGIAVREFSAEQGEQ